MKGFALFLSLMLILILSVFAYWLLLMSQAHYASSRTLFESDNARIISDAAVQSIVQKHNYEQPRFFFDPLRWNRLQLKEYSWNGYRITGSLSATWSASQPNLLLIRADKGRYASEVQALARQLRLEYFALFSNHQQTLATSTLFDGAVYTASLLAVQKPVRFRGLVYNEATPAFNASYRRKSQTYLEFPELTELFPGGWNAGGISVTSKNPLFWQNNEYVLDLDGLDIAAAGKNWRVSYHGKVLGDTTRLGISFDDRVRVHQTYQEMPWLNPAKTEQSFYIVSAGDLTFDSNVQSLQRNSYILRFCFVSSKNVRIAPVDTAERIEAMIVAYGDAFVDAGSVVLDDAQKESWKSEISGSAFLVEPVAKSDLLQAIETNEKALWLRGSLAIGGELHAPADLSQLHFEATRRVHPALMSFPYVEIVEGGEQWQ